MTRNHVILNKYQKIELLQEYKKIQESANRASLFVLADRAKEKFQLQKTSRVTRNETKIRYQLDNANIRHKYVFL